MGGIFLLIMVVCLGTPALRLLISAARERREIELWLGLALGFAAVALPMRFASGIEVVQLIERGMAIPDQLAVLAGVSHVLASLASVWLYVFVWRVFHPGAPGVRAGVGLVAASVLLSLLWVLGSGAHLVERHESIVVSNLLRSLAFPWCTYESARYWRMMKRRLKFGIGDPVVANRFALWAIWTGAFSTLPLLVLAGKITVQLTQSSVGMLELILPMIRVTAVCGVTTAFVCIWLSFFPTAGYLNHLRSTAREVADPV